MTKPKKTEDEAPEVAPELAEPVAAADDTEVPEVAADEPWPPTGFIMVYQDSHNAPAFILQANEDRTLDLMTDLYGLGSNTILFGVHRRQGNGNGWEPA